MFSLNPVNIVYCVNNVLSLWMIHIDDVHTVMNTSHTVPLSSYLSRSQGTHLSSSTSNLYTALGVGDAG